MLSSNPPRIITTLRTVPRGTNGGVSSWGLLVSLLGGLLVGVTSSLSLAYDNGKECSELFDARWGLPWWALVMGVGAWSGLVGSLVSPIYHLELGRTYGSNKTLATQVFAQLRQTLINLVPQVDSVLGATLQQSLYSSSRLKIVHSKTTKDDDDVVVPVAGSGLNVLSNNGVNIISASGTAVAVIWWV